MCGSRLMRKPWERRRGSSDQSDLLVAGTRVLAHGRFHMTRPDPPDAPPASLRLLAEQALSRAAGAPLVPGNRLKLLRDATENYPAWLDAIEGAKRSITMESYILADDAVGNRFADAMGAASRRGVRVRVLQDW